MNKDKEGYLSTDFWTDINDRIYLFNSMLGVNRKYANNVIEF